MGDDAPLQKGDERGLEGEPRGRADSRDEPARVTAELAARVRHEINNPLTGLIGQAQLLLREDLSDVARRRILTIEQLANRIRDTVAELRIVQRTNASGGVPYEGQEPGGPPRH